MNNNFDNSNWNEYQWEKEIRRDEKRINHYFQELTSCIDLPDEEDILMKKIMAQPDLVPSKPQTDSFTFNDFHEDDDDEFIFWNSARFKNGGETLSQLEKLAMEWNIIYAGRLHPDAERDGMCIVCSFGKLISRYVCAINTDEFSALKVSLLKRMMNETNQLVGDLIKISGKQPDLSSRIDEVINMLKSIREKIFDQMVEIREQQ
jgi:hypothetical protein